LGLYFALHSDDYHRPDLSELQLNYNASINANLNRNNNLNSVDSRKQNEAYAGTKFSRSETLETNIDFGINQSDSVCYSLDSNDFVIDDSGVHSALLKCSTNESNEAAQSSKSKVDSYLDEFIELIVRDFIMSWMSSLTWEEENLSALIK
jgi:hypothetical protein